MLDRKIFKKYDIRGIYPEEIDSAGVAEIASCLIEFFGRGPIIIGRDGRLSSPKLYNALRRTLTEKRKKDVVAAGLITTPTLYFLVSKMKAAGGAMVTASHNPKQYNGLKIVGPKAKMISGEKIFRLLAKK